MCSTSFTQSLAPALTPRGLYVSMSDIRHRLIEFAKCPFDFSMESVCGEDKCPITFLSAWSLSSYFFVTLGHHVADPMTGCSPSI